MSSGYPSTYLILGLNIKVTGQNMQKHSSVEGDRVAGASLHSIECSAHMYFYVRQLC